MQVPRTLYLGKKSSPPGIVVQVYSANVPEDRSHLENACGALVANQFNHAMHRIGVQNVGGHAAQGAAKLFQFGSHGMILSTSPI